MTQRCHYMWRADGNAPHDWQVKPLRLLAREPKRPVEHPLPTFLYPHRHFAFCIAPFYGSVIESQAVLADFDQAKAGIVTRVQTIAFGGDAIPVELPLTTIGIVIQLFHDVQNGPGHNLRVVRIQTLESIDDLSDLLPRKRFDSVSSIRHPMCSALAGDEFLLLGRHDRHG